MLHKSEHNSVIGYSGNGYYCTDIDECAVFNGGCSVNPMVRCINTPVSFKIILAFCGKFQNISISNIK